MNKTLEERWQDFLNAEGDGDTPPKMVARMAFMEGVLAAMEIIIGTDSSDAMSNCLELMTAARDFKNHE